MNYPPASNKPRSVLVGFLFLVLALFSVGTMAVVTVDGGPIYSKLEEQGRVDNLRVTALRASKQDNLLRIQAEITNLSSSSQQLYYRFKWLDNDGFVVWEDEPWKPISFTGNQKQIISVGSPTLKATDFRLVLQSPN